MKIALIFIACSIVSQGFAQPNCNVYKMNNDEACYKACMMATESEAAQGYRDSQLAFDKAIQLCPTLDYAYVEKAVPYLKRGDFITWKKLIDQAVALNPTGRLGYRGWCRFQFLRDYRGAINDFETLDSLLSGDIGYSQNGDYHLQVALALCYKAIGQKQKAIELIEQQLAKKGYSPLTYDYLHVGVLKMETGNTEEAITYFHKSIAYNDYLADPYYFLGILYNQKGKSAESKANLLKAKEYYLKGYRRFDPYTHPMDKIYLSDIESALRNL